MGAGVGYELGDLTSVYPLARGSAPVLVLVVSVAALGAHLSTAAVMGVIAVGGRHRHSGLQGAGRIAGDCVGAGCGVTIAAYTLVDKEGLKHAAPVPYLGAMQVLPALVYLSLTMRLRGRPAVRPPLARSTALAGSG